MKLNYSGKEHNQKTFNITFTHAELTMMYLAFGTVDADYLSGELESIADPSDPDSAKDITDAASDLRSDFAQMQIDFLNKFHDKIPVNSIVRQVPVWSNEDLRRQVKPKNQAKS